MNEGGVLDDKENIRIRNFIWNRLNGKPGRRHHMGVRCYFISINYKTMGKAALPWLVPMLAGYIVLGPSSAGNREKRMINGLAAYEHYYHYVCADMYCLIYP